MKRFLSLLVCLVVMAILTIPAINAEDNEITYNGGEYGSTVNYTNPSNFCVVIPQTIEASEVVQFTALSMNITDDEQVTVSLKNDVTLNQIGGNGEAHMIFSNTEDGAVARFFKEELTSQFAVSPMVINANEIPAGDYRGTATFVVSLTNK